MLALVVYAVRAQLLRLREYHADVAATPIAADRAEFTAALASLTPAARGASATPSGAKRRGARPPTWLALHPTAAQRAAVVADPGLLDAPRPASLLAAGLVAGAAYPPLVDILAGTLPPLYAGCWSRGVLFGLAGMVAGAEVVRAAATGRAGARAFALPAAALVAGAALGAATSVGATGLDFRAGPEALGASVIGLVVAALVVGGGDAAVAHAGPRNGAAAAVAVLLGGVAAGLTAVHWAPVALSVAEGVWAVDVVPVLALTTTVFAVAAVVGLGAAALVPRRSWVPVLRAAGIAAGLTLVAHPFGALALGSLDDIDLVIGFRDAMVPLVLGTALVAGAVVTLRHGAAAGVVTGALGAGVAAGGFLLVVAVFGADPTGDDVPWLAAWWATFAVVFGVPTTALTALVHRSAATRASRRAAAAAVVLAAVVLGGVAYLWVAPRALAAVAQPEAEDALQSYLAGDLPVLRTKWELARTNAEPAPYMNDPAAFWGEYVLPLYDEALDSAKAVTPWVETTGDPVLAELHAALVDAIAADRAYWQALAAQWAGTGDAAAVDEALRAADRANERFDAAHTAALDVG